MKMTLRNSLLRGLKSLSLIVATIYMTLIVTNFNSQMAMPKAENIEQDNTFIIMNNKESSLLVQNHRVHSKRTNNTNDDIAMRIWPISHRALSKEEIASRAEEIRVEFDPLCEDRLAQDFLEQVNMEHNYPITTQQMMGPDRQLCDDKTFLLIIIHTIHGNVDKRHITRKTWGSYANSKANTAFKGLDIGPIKYLFVVGNDHNAAKQKKMIEENRLYNDIIQGDFTEHYFNITLKTQFALRWAKDNCPAAKFIAKTDDDIFLNLFAISKMLKKLSDTQHGLIIGGCWEDKLVPRLPRDLDIRKVFRQRRYKFRLSCDELPLKRHPTWTPGHGYIISRNASNAMLKLSTKIKPFRVEDQYFTGILRHVLGDKVEVKCMPGFSDSAKHLNVPETPLVETYTLTYPDNMGSYVNIWQTLVGNFTAFSNTTI